MRDFAVARGPSLLAKPVPEGQGAVLPAARDAAMPSSTVKERPDT